MDVKSLLEILGTVVNNWGPEFLGLGVLTFFVPAVIDLLKKVGVEDGQAGVVNNIIQLVLFILFVGTRLFGLDVDVTGIDGILVMVGKALAMLLSVVGQSALSVQAYKRVWKGRFGALGFSHSA